MRYAPRRAHVPYWWLLATAAAAFIAVGPIVAAFFASLGDGPRTAFASAPEGNYAVVARMEPAADVLVAVGAADGTAREIGRIGHLPGYGSYGAVSPDGTLLALVVTDGGVQAHPVASLVVVELETGKATKIAGDIDYLQTPVWRRDGSGVVVTRTGGDGASADVTLIEAAAAGAGEVTLGTAEDVLGAYPVGFDGQGRLLHVAIDGRGSTLYRGGTEVASLAPGITRDWRLNADATALAFIETQTSAGVKYVGRVVELEGGVSGQGLDSTSEGQSLGVAWSRASAQPLFGREPRAPAPGVAAQARSAAGFDVPLAYSADGAALAVQRWTGASFAEPGKGSFEIVVSDGARREMPGYGRFYGWAAR